MLVSSHSAERGHWLRTRRTTFENNRKKRFRIFSLAGFTLSLNGTPWNKSLHNHKQLCSHIASQWKKSFKQEFYTRWDTCVLPFEGNCCCSSWNAKVSGFRQTLSWKPYFMVKTFPLGSETLVLVRNRFVLSADWKELGLKLAWKLTFTL